MTAWTDHVKNYAQQNGVSYKQAMSESKNSYNKMSGGNFKNFERKVSNSLRTGERKIGNSLNKLNTVQRKVKNTTKKIIDETAPLVSLVSPELALGLQGVKQAIGGGRLGSKKNPYALKGGSFRTMSESQGGSISGKNVCHHCGGMTGGHLNNSSMVYHPSFNALPRKSFSKSLITN